MFSLDSRWWRIGEKEKKWGIEGACSVLNTLSLLCETLVLENVLFNRGFEEISAYAFESFENGVLTSIFDIPSVKTCDSLYHLRNTYASLL